MAEIVQRWFESSVISYGSEARSAAKRFAVLFESSVISYGSEAWTGYSM